jgi:hypothetical protein
VREYEKLGVEATKAMQTAARRVDEENKRLMTENGKLRSLLHKSGYDDANIEQCLALEPEPSAGLAADPHGHRQPAQVVQALQTMFTTRRFLDAPSLVSPIEDDMPEMSTSPVWPHHHSGHHHARRTLSQDCPPEAAYALHALSAANSGYDAAAAAMGSAFASGLEWGPGGPSGSTSGGSAGAQMSSSSGASAGPMSRASHDEYDDDHDGAARMADMYLGRSYVVPGWVEDRRR